MMVLRLWLVTVLAPCSLTSAADSEEVPLTSVQIEVVDRFGNPVPGTKVGIARQVKWPKGMQPSYQRLEERETDSSGRVSFQNLQVGDYVGAATLDGRFQGQLQLPASPTSQQLILSNPSGIGIGHRGEFQDGVLDQASEAAKALRTILDHLVESQSEEFLSLNDYVRLGVIESEEAEILIALGPKMGIHESYINFLWSNFRLLEPNLEEPLKWREMVDQPWTTGRWHPGIPRAKRPGLLKRLFQNHSPDRK